jgi:O-antigen/teichoic acid export membrane protein
MRVVKNIAVLLASQLGTWMISLVLTLVVPSYLGPDHYGLYGFVGSYVGFFALGMQLGTGTYLTWRIAREPEMAPRLFLNTVLLQIPLIVGCGLVAFLVVPALDPSPFVRELVLLQVAVQGMTAVGATCIATLAGFQIMRVPALINLFTGVVSAALLLMSIPFHASLDVFILTSLIGQTLAFIALVLYMLHVVPMRGRLGIDPHLWKAIGLGGLPFFSWSLVLLFYSQISITMLKVIEGNTAVGWYSAANRIAGIPVFLPSIVIIAILPALSAERSADSPRFRELASRSLRLVTLVAIPAAVGMILLAGHITALLHFPHSFNAVGPVVVVLSINLPLIALDMVLGTVLIALGRQKAWAYVGLVAAIVNPLANLWAIPYTMRAYGNGAIGAAAVMVLTELVMFVGALILRPRNIFTRWDLWYIGRCVIAAVVMIPAVFALAKEANIGTFSAVAYGVIVYAMASYTLQTIRNDDVRGLFNLVAGRLGLAQLGYADDRRAYAAVTTHTRTIDGGGLTNPSLAAVNASASALPPQARQSVPEPLASLGATHAQLRRTSIAVLEVGSQPESEAELALAMGASSLRALESDDDGWITITYEGNDDVTAVGRHITQRIPSQSRKRAKASTQRGRTPRDQRAHALTERGARGGKRAQKASAPRGGRMRAPARSR